jgi:hypothetical protein
MERPNIEVCQQDWEYGQGPSGHEAKTGYGYDEQDVPYIVGKRGGVDLRMTSTRAVVVELPCYRTKGAAWTPEHNRIAREPPPDVHTANFVIKERVLGKTDPLGPAAGPRGSVFPRTRSLITKFAV